VCCIVLQCVTVCRVSHIQGLRSLIVACCSVLQCVASVLQCVTVFCSVSCIIYIGAKTSNCNCVATCCSVLQ